MARPRVRVELSQSQCPDQDQDWISPCLKTKNQEYVETKNKDDVEIKNMKDLVTKIFWNPVWETLKTETHRDHGI